MDTIEDGTRAQITEFLPAALEKSVNSYYRFMEQEVPLKSKEFSEHHKAGKVAVSHIELLIKLARWADAEETEENEAFGTLFDDAKGDFSRHQAATPDRDENES